MVSHEPNILQFENIFYSEHKNIIQSDYNQCFWVGTNKSDVVKVTENNVVIPGIPPLCDQELKNAATFEYTVAVNDKKYETAVESNPRRVIVRDGKFMTCD